MADVNWTDAQWQMVNDCVMEAFRNASAATAFLNAPPPLPASAETVRNDRLAAIGPTRPPTLRLDADHDGANLKLVNLTVRVELSSEQVADETLSNALLAFSRAAAILAQQQELVVFEGLNRGGATSDFVSNGVSREQLGLADPGRREDFRRLESGAQGARIVSAVVDAIRDLEDNLNPGPFACVLGNRLFVEAHSPAASFVLPADRITPLLKGGPLLRAGKMDPDTGVVVSLAARSIDIVVATPPTVQFLQKTQDAKFLFRVYERFALRIRDEKPPIAGFTLTPAARRRRAAGGQARREAGTTAG